MFGKKLAEEVKDYVRECYARKVETEVLHAEVCTLRAELEALKKHLGVKITLSPKQHVVAKKKKN